MCAEKGVAFGIAELHKGPRDILERAALLDQIGETMVFEHLEEAATAFARLSPGATPKAVALAIALGRVAPREEFRKVSKGVAVQRTR